MRIQNKKHEIYKVYGEKEYKLREKRLRTSSWRREGDNSNGFLLE